MLKVGLVGWRGMVGSVLMQRMQEENDFAHFEPIFFSTSNAGGKAPAFAGNVAPLEDANKIDALKKMDVVLTCQLAYFQPLILKQQVKRFPRHAKFLVQ